MNYSTFSVNDFIELFSQKNFNPPLLISILESNCNNSINYPGLPQVLYENNKLECLEIYFNYLLQQDKDYLVIHFFSQPDNISSKTLPLAIPFLDNIISTFLDKMEINKALELVKAYPESIKEHCVIKLIKIYETNQSHFFDLPQFNILENYLISAFDKYSEKEKIFSSIESVIPVISLLIKFANNTYEPDSLEFLDNYFKSKCPNYMENYIEKLILNRTLNNKLNEKNKTNTIKI